MTIHKNTRLTPIQRKQLADDYFKRHTIICDLCRKYQITPPTTYKIIHRSRNNDHSIHKSINKQFRCLEYGIKRLSKIEKQSEEKQKKKASASLKENSDEIKKYLILSLDKEIEECWKKFDECNKNKSGDYEQNIKPQAENLSHFPLLQKPTMNKEEERNWIKNECERFQEKRQKLKEFKK